MGETRENWVTHQNDWTPPLKYHPELKTKEPVGIVIWDLKGEEGSFHGDGEASVCKQVFAGPAETGTQRGIVNRQTLLGSSPPTHPVHSIVI